MGKYLKKFSTDSARVEYEGSENYIEPYVSYVEGDNTVHYNKVETRIIATYNVEDASNPTQLYMYMNQQDMTILGIDMFSKVEIDGTEVAVADLDTAQGQYQFSGGEHTVKYTLKDPTMIGVEADEETGMPSKVGATFVSCPITSVEIPDSVTSIGEGAFSECGSLTSVTIPNSVTTIGDSAFYNCTSLTSVTIPNSVTSISSSAFHSCTGLTSVTIGNGVTSIAQYTFYRCFNLTSVTMSNSVTSIGKRAFASCESLTSIAIPDSVTSIGEYAFDYCYSLTSITIPNSVTSIGEFAFHQCYGLTSVAIPDGVTSISNQIFESCSGLTSCTIGSGVTSIGNRVFYGCTNLASITSLATTAPTIQDITFFDVGTGGVLYVPSGSSGYDVWMGTGNYYLGKYGWGKIEQ